MVSKIFKQILRHKLITFIIVVIIIAGGYFVYQKLTKNKSTVRYVTATVERGTLISSVSGSGQVSNSYQVDVKAKVSGDVLKIFGQNGQIVKVGDVLVKLDDRDALKALRDAQANFESAQIALEKLLKPADELTILQAENALKNAKDALEKLKLSQQLQYQRTLETKERAEDDLKKAYDDGFNTVANAFLDLPTVMAGLQDILFKTEFNITQDNIDYYANAVRIYDQKVDTYRDDTFNNYQKARVAYDKNFDDYKVTTRYSDATQLEFLINETYETTKMIAEAVKSASNLIQFYQDKLTERDLTPQSLSYTHLSLLSSYTSKTNAHLLNLFAIKRTIQNSRDTIVNTERDLRQMDQNNPLDLAAAENTVKEKEAALRKLKAGPDELDIASQKLIVTQRKNTLLDAQEKLNDYTIKAPVDGVIASLNVKKRGETVSAGSVIATIIGKQRLAEISLNEVDAVRVKVGQKATLTFDALPDLTIAGEVVEMDTVGTISQGVVSYTVKISFETQDERVKPGMSVTASIIIEAKPDVLLVPNSALKEQNGHYYVEMPDESEINLAKANSFGVTLTKPLKRQFVTIGSANEEYTEITSGLKEGDLIVNRIISSQINTQKTQPSGSIFRFPSMPGVRGR